MIGELLTQRLRLRQWRDADRAPFAAMGADPVVMQFYPATQSREGSDATVAAWQTQLAQQGWGNWAVDLLSTGEFIGYVGLTVPKRWLPFSPCVEIGWRLARQHWRQGFATEAAQAALRVGFDQVGLAEIVSFTTKLNLPSQAVMRRIGMQDSGEDFDYPSIAEGHPQRRHCLYRLSRARWQALQADGAEQPVRA